MNVISAFGEEEKALASIVFTLSEINISFMFLQPSKIEPFIARPDSHSTFSKLSQRAKQNLPTSIPLFKDTSFNPLRSND